MKFFAALKAPVDPAMRTGLNENARAAHLSMQIEVRILDPRIGREFQLPRYGTSGSAGLDLLACLATDTLIQPKESLLVPSGIAIHIDDGQYMAMLAPRSGLGIKHRIILSNSIGVIDSDYQNEIKIALWNAGERAYSVSPGERICQLIIVQIRQAKLKVVEDFTQSSDRGLGGIGHTGRF